MADSDQPKDSFATRISKQFDQMIKNKASQRGKELAAQQQAQQQKQAQAPQQQTQPQQQENRSTIEQIKQNKEATEKAAKDIEQY